MPCRVQRVYLIAIASLEAQTFDAYEVVAVDDGRATRRRSSPHGLVGMGGCGAALARPRPAAALNAGLEAARGELVARMDADDAEATRRRSRSPSSMPTPTSPPAAPASATSPTVVATARAATSAG